jgi:EAL domain-containing protein (putative c-di-GMP-specific phosphodiesterase class I)
MRQWLADGLPLDTMAVNVSPKQFRDPSFIDRVRAVLDETGLPAQYLELEVTESEIMEFGAASDARLAALGDLGVRLAIDDFGAGHSSLANLKRLPVQTLKIDRSFLKDVPGDRVSTGVVLMITTLASHLHLQTVAEGVENEAQRRLLQESGCDLAQGYLFGRPVAPEEIAVMEMV